MLLSELIEVLTKLRDSKPQLDPTVDILNEEFVHSLDGDKVIQYQRKVTDVAYSSRSGVIIIGQELD